MYESQEGIMTKMKRPREHVYIPAVAAQITRTKILLYKEFTQRAKHVTILELFVFQRG
jgi:hypothetical protein